MKIAHLMQQQRFSKMSLKDLLKMDHDGDGRITENEFTIAVLTSMGCVREATIELIHAQFRFLDKDSKGYLDRTVVHQLGKLRDSCRRYK
jgi:Ca2+-binding EF-hand superfamily protein